MTDAEKKLGLKIAYGLCPSCKHLLILRSEGRYWEPEDGSTPVALTDVTSECLIFPGGPAHVIEDQEVPERYRQDFLEASAVLPISPKASAAISRRVLQDVLQSCFKIPKGRLVHQIADFVGRGEAPQYLLEAIDAIREIGNLAAHPAKDQMTGSIVDVEPGEAEWVLNTLEALLDFAFTQPERLANRKAALQKKLEATRRGPGKPEIRP